MRFELKFLLNGVEIEKTRRLFNSKIYYPSKLFCVPVEVMEGVGIPQNDPLEFEMWHTSVEAEQTMEKVVDLLKKVMQADSTEYLYNFYTDNGYAKEGSFSLPLSKKNTLTVVVVDNEFPLYDTKGKLSNKTTSFPIIETNVCVDEYVMHKEFIPNFWKVFYDFDESVLNAPKRCDGDQKGIQTLLQESMRTKPDKLTNKMGNPQETAARLCNKNW